MTKKPKRTRADRSPEGLRAALVALYEQLPKMQCKGLCAHSCSSLVQTMAERDRIADTTGIELRTVQIGPCPALTILNRCGAYEVRPTICRLWGMGESPHLRCPHGCEPDGGLLSVAQTDEYLARAADIDGDRATARFLRGRTRG